MKVSNHSGFKLHAGSITMILFTQKDNSRITNRFTNTFKIPMRTALDAHGANILYGKCFLTTYVKKAEQKKMKNKNS